MKLCLRCLIFFTSLCFFCIHCTSKEFSYSRFIVGGHCEIKFSYHSEKTAEKIISQIEDELVRIDSLLNRFSEKSLVSELNRNLRVKAPGDIIYLFALSDTVSRMTDGLFDISIAPLLETWGFYKHEFKDPDTVEIKKIKKLVDYRKIQLENDSIIIPEGMKVDLGGIAQGFAADRAAMILKEYNVKSALINIGGEIAVIGQSPKGRSWRIGIKNPRGKGIIETVELKDEALSTSGDYEKFFIINNKRYPHIINPKTGFPALDFVSVTIFAKNAAFADAIATATAIMGPEKGLIFLDSLGIEGIIYYEENGCLQRVEKR
jgi:thiamine biosynthesis lipoprotein